VPPHLDGAGKLRISHLLLMTCDFFYILLSLQRHFVKEKSQKRLVIIFFLVYNARKSGKGDFSRWKLKGMLFRTIYITTKSIFGQSGDKGLGTNDFPKSWQGGVYVELPSRQGTWAV
jgi:hypothetical protein